MKIYIEDVVKRMEGKTEEELPKGTGIYIVLDNGDTLTVTPEDDGVKIYKSTKLVDHEIVIKSLGSNTIKVR